MTTELVPAPKTASAMRYSAGGMMPTTFEEAWRMAQLCAASDLVPKDYKDKPENCLVAMQMGAELGLKPLQALQGIAVINGRPSVWGDALWALVQSSPLVADAWETFDEQTMTATCGIQRKDRREPTVQRFSQEDAVMAGLWGKQGPWKTNPRRMLQMRARAFAGRDAVPDVLKGLAVAEEAIDIPPPVEPTTELPRGTAGLVAAMERSRTAPSAPGTAEPAGGASTAPEPRSPEGASEAQPVSASRLADSISFLDELDKDDEITTFAATEPEAIRAAPEFERAVTARREAIKKRKTK